MTPRLLHDKIPFINKIPNTSCPSRSLQTDESLVNFVHHIVNILPLLEQTHRSLYKERIQDPMSSWEHRKGIASERVQRREY
jgi:hypothetical protein